MPRLASAADAATSLRQGGLVAHPTSSLYGIAADPLQDAGLDALDALKGREPGRGYVLVAAAAADCRGWFAEVERLSSLLAWPWPFPLTIVAPAGQVAPARVRHLDGTVAIRVDSHPAVLALGAALRQPWVSTSLNLPGAPPLPDCANLPMPLARALAGVFDFGPPPSGQPSTILRVLPQGAVVVRLGALTLQAVAEALSALALPLLPGPDGGA